MDAKIIQKDWKNGQENGLFDESSIIIYNI